MPDIINQNNDREELNIERFENSKKDLSLLIIVLILLATVAAIFLTAAFIMTKVVVSSKDVTAFLILFTLPILLVAMFFELLFSIPAFVISLRGCILCKFKTPLNLIIFIVSSLYIIYVVVLFLMLMLPPLFDSPKANSSEVISSIAFML